MSNKWLQLPDNWTAQIGKVTKKVHYYDHIDQFGCDDVDVWSA